MRLFDRDGSELGRTTFVVEKSPLTNISAIQVLISRMYNRNVSLLYPKVFRDLDSHSQFPLQNPRPSSIRFFFFLLYPVISHSLTIIAHPLGAPKPYPQDEGFVKIRTNTLAFSDSQIKQQTTINKGYKPVLN